MSTTAVKNDTSTIPDNWENIRFTSEDMVDAFERGIQHHIDTQEKEEQETYKKNLSRAAVLSEGIFHTANSDYGVFIKRAYLKVESLENYDVLFLVNYPDFVSAKIKDIYKRSHLIKSEFNCDDFHISFKFMPTSENLNTDSIYSDGYTLEYGKDKSGQTN